MSDTFSVTLRHNGHTQQIQVAPGVAILAAAIAQDIDLPHSCEAGVCTTCAAWIESGTVDQSEALGIVPKVQAQGYVLLCVARPTSDLVIDTHKEDEVYHVQTGR